MAPNVRLPASAVVAVVQRPWLWTTAIGAALGLAPAGWWRRAPFLPLPDTDWLHFRIVTAYGGAGDTPMQARDLVAWLEWKHSIRT